MAIKIGYHTDRDGVEFLLAHAEQHKTAPTAVLIEHAVDQGWLTTYVIPETPKPRRRRNRTVEMAGE